MKDIEYWIWLSRIEGLNPKFLNDLLGKYKNPKTIWNRTKEELLEDGIKEKYVEEITNSNYRQSLDKYIKYMNENNIEIITIKDKEYPDKLKVIYDPPIVLYVKGNKNILNDNAVAVVGCRLSSKYGENTAKKLAYNLSLNNINIISGLAKGIDSFAHKGSLAARGKTIAVVGCGLDRVYPEENRNLFSEIIKNDGTIISEYIIGTRPLAKNFPKRNRIISGLSNGLIVVEAREKSGTLITVDFALEQGKTIYAVPGNIDNLNSYGTNDLIKQGAKIITKIEDVLEDLQ
ncbi:MAG: DNA-processing protein DprA [Clostridia bacterium]|nr:DNA-processing protein DprA [Clostridia bacterium]